METSPAGRAAIERREGLRLTAYRDAIGILTIGYGHTSAAGEPRVTAGLVVTRAEASAILARDLRAFERAVAEALSVPVSPGEFDAMVSLCFNVGPANFARSSVLRRVNRGDRAGAADAFLAWNKAGGRVLPGLTRRREEERAQFLAGAGDRAADPVPPPTAPAPAPPRRSGLLDALRRVTGRS